MANRNHVDIFRLLSSLMFSPDVTVTETVKILSDKFCKKPLGGWKVNCKKRWELELAERKENAIHLGKKKKANEKDEQEIKLTNHQTS